MNLLRAILANRRLSRTPAPSKKVAIVVPLGTVPGITESEEISLRHLRHYLGSYDKFVVASRGTPVELGDDFEVIRMDDRFFGSAQAHALMQLSPEFYEQFLDYEFVLIYHLDALVFSDEIESWCDRNYDFIGAPWFKTDETPWVDEPKVGNTGFALMRVRQFLRVLYSRKRMYGVRDELRRSRQRSGGKLEAVHFLKALRRVFFYRNNIQTHIKSILMQGMASDIFWSNNAERYLPSFRTASAAAALSFAFEVDPETCFQKTKGKMPFGCHAWERYDRKFWEPYLLSGSLTSEMQDVQSDPSWSERSDKAIRIS